MRRLLLIPVIVALGGFALLPARATTGTTTLTVAGDTVEILRDSYGVPHVFARTERGVYFGNGYAVAQDRLAQMEAYRRTARGEMAELTGSNRARRQDEEARREGYTEAEREAQVQALPTPLRDAVQAYADGVNAYIAEIEKSGYPGPVKALGLKIRPWRPTDSIAIGQMMARRFGSGGGGELRNLQVLQAMKALFGQNAERVVGDLIWKNDPTSPATIPARESPRMPDVTRQGMEEERGRVEGEKGNPHTTRKSAIRVNGNAHRRQPIRTNPQSAIRNPQSTQVPPAQAALIPTTQLAWESVERARAAADLDAQMSYAREHGLPTKLGSYAIAVSPSRTVSGAPILVGGPQMGFSTPQIAHEVHLNGPGLNVVGMGFSGIPGVLIGHNDRVAWSTTTGVGDVEDIFVETLNPDNPRQYRHNGQWKEMERRTERIMVRNGEPVELEVYRTVHGPVIEISPDGKTAYAKQMSYWGREAGALEAVFRFNRAQNLREFAAGVPLIASSHNWLVATQDGDIGYWFAGRFPVRAAGIDQRLPTPGTGEYDWKGILPFEQTPQIVNPKQGWLANWNNKPAVWWDHSDTPVWGAVFRVQRIFDLLAAKPKLTEDDIRRVLRDIGTHDESAPSLKPLLLQAAKGQKLEPQVAQALQYLQAWDNHGDEGSVGKTIWDAYVDTLRMEVFDEFAFITDRGLLRQVISPSVMLRALQGKKAAVPLQVNYLGDRKPSELQLSALAKAVDTLAKERGPQVDAWRYQQNRTRFEPLPPIPATARGTYIQIVTLGKPLVHGVSILPPGQSEDPSDPHFGDQRELAGYWLFKPMLSRRADLR